MTEPEIDVTMGAEETEQIEETEKIEETAETEKIEETVETEVPEEPVTPEEQPASTGSETEDTPQPGERPQQEVSTVPAEQPEMTVRPVPEELPVSAEQPETVQIPVAHSTPAAEQERTKTIAHTETIERTDSGEAGKKQDDAVKKTVAVVAVTTGCLGGVAGICAGLVYLFAMAEVDTIGIDGRKKRLGRRLIRSEKGRICSIELCRDILERCETDRICIRMSSVFVRFHRNRSLIVKAREKRLTGYINREVYLTLPSL